MRVPVITFVAAIAIGCSPGGQVVYPHPAGEPGEEPGPDSTGVRCDNPSASCRDIAPGTGDAVKAFALVSVRLTVDDLVDPPLRIGPHTVRLLHPRLGTIPFGGRQRDLTIDMLQDAETKRIGEPAFFETDADALVGTWITGMRRGGVRQIRGRYTGRLARQELTPGRDRIIEIALLDFCYPIVTMTSGWRWSGLLGSSGNAIDREPRLTVAGCAAPLRE